MGQLIDFGNGKNVKKQLFSSTDASEELVSLLPRLKVLEKEFIVIKICNGVIKKPEILNKTIKDIVTLKCMGVNVIIVADSDDKIGEYFKENYKESGFTNSNFICTNGISDVIEVLIKHDSAKKILENANKYNVMAMMMGGCELNILLQEEASKNNVDTFSYQQKSLSKCGQVATKRYSIDLLNEILKTDILPIILPTFKDKQNNEYVLNSGMFAMYLSKYLNALKYTIVYTDNDLIPTSCMYGIEKFVRIIKTSNLNDETLRTINPAIEAVRNGVQTAHIIDPAKTSILREFCNGSLSGLLLYDDTLNQL